MSDLNFQLFSNLREVCDILYVQIWTVVPQKYSKRNSNIFIIYYLSVNTQALPATQAGQIMNMPLAGLPADRDLTHIPMNLSPFQLQSTSFKTEQSTDDKESLKFFKLIFNKLYIQIVV